MDLLIFLNYVTSLAIIVTIIRLYCNRPRCYLNKDLTGKIAIVTGASAGIGKETAKALLTKGATVIFACRNKAKTLDLISNLTKNSINKNAFFIELNLSSFKSIAKFFDEFSKKFSSLDFLINNAGTFCEKFSLTEDKIEETFQTNHLGHFALTGLLLKFLALSDDPRILNVSSNLHSEADYALDYLSFQPENFRMWKMYAISKAANIFFSEALSEFANVTPKKIDNNKYAKILSCAVHPGAVFTEIFRVSGKPLWYKLIIGVLYRPVLFLFYKDEEIGAQTTLHCLLTERRDFSNGGYYADCALACKSDKIRAKSLETRVHKISYEAINNAESFEKYKELEGFKLF